MQDDKYSQESTQKNVFGESLQLCSCTPMTGYFRDGLCRTDATDIGMHTVCAVMTKDFLTFSKSKGNDLSTPRPEFRFPGLKPGDKWCLCALRWVEAEQAGMAPEVILEACHESVLEVTSLEVLSKYARMN